MPKSILFITAFPPNNMTAGQNYTMHLLEDLSTDYDIEVIGWNYKGHSMCLPSNVKLLATYPVNPVWKSVFMAFILGIFPFFIIRFNWTALTRIKRLASNYDYLYFDFGQVFIYSMFLKHPHKIKMCHDVISQKYSRTKLSFVYSWWVRLSEKRLLNRDDVILCFSEKDRRLINSLGREHLHVVPFYIDDRILHMDMSIVPMKKKYFVFYGAWSRKENSEGLLWFVKNVLPLCNENISFKVVGGGIPSQLLSIIQKNLSIEYLGFIDNPYEVIASSQALIAPLFNGAGVKVKVIESLALGTSVIGTEIAFEGIRNLSVCGKEVLLRACTQEDFADIINRFSLIGMKEKKEIRDKFLLTYSSHSLSTLLREERL